MTDQSRESGTEDELASIITQHLRENDPLQPWLTESHWDDRYWDEEARLIAQRLERGMTKQAVRTAIEEVLKPLLGIDQTFEARRLESVASAVAGYLNDGTSARPSHSSNGRMSPADYMGKLRQRFPELAPTLDEEEWRGLLHVETAMFAAFCREAIDNGDRDLVEKCYSFARQSAVDGTDKVENAIGVSFVEHLNFRDGKVPRRWAYNLLPPRLKADAEALGVAPD